MHGGQINVGKGTLITSDNSERANNFIVSDQTFLKAEPLHNKNDGNGNF